LASRLKPGNAFREQERKQEVDSSCIPSTRRGYAHSNQRPDCKFGWLVPADSMTAVFISTFMSDRWCQAQVGEVRTEP